MVKVLPSDCPEAEDDLKTRSSASTFMLNKEHNHAPLILATFQAMKWPSGLLIIALVRFKPFELDNT